MGDWRLVRKERDRRRTRPNFHGFLEFDSHRLGFLQIVLTSLSFNYMLMGSTGGSAAPNGATSTEGTD